MSSVIIQDPGSPTIEVRQNNETILIETTLPGGIDAGGGDVNVSGTPTINQAAAWVDDDTIRGTPVCEYDDVAGRISMRLGATNTEIATWESSGGRPRLLSALSVDFETTGASLRLLNGSTTVDLAASSVTHNSDSHVFQTGAAVAIGSFTSAGLLMDNASGPLISNADASETVPTLIPDQSDPDTGIGTRNFAGTLAFICNGAAVATMQTTSFTVNQSLRVQTVVVGPSAVLPLRIGSNAGAGAPSVSTGDDCYVHGDFEVNGIVHTDLSMSNANGPQLTDAAATSTAPTLVPDRAFPTTGIGHSGTQNLHLVVNGAEKLKMDAGTITSQIDHRFQNSIIGVGGVGIRIEGAGGSASNFSPLGNDAYVEGNLEVDTDTYLDGDLTVTGKFITGETDYSVRVVQAKPAGAPVLTTTERDAVTAANGMFLYNSTTGKFQGRAGGAWVDFHA